MITNKAISQAINTRTVRVRSISLEALVALTDLNFTVILVSGGQNEQINRIDSDRSISIPSKRHLRLLKSTK